MYVLLFWNDGMQWNREPTENNMENAVEIGSDSFCCFLVSFGIAECDWRDGISEKRRTIGRSRWSRHFLTDIDSVTQSQYCTKTVYHVLVWECAVADPILDTAYKFGSGHQWRTQETRYNSLFSWDDEK